MHYNVKQRNNKHIHRFQGTQMYRGESCGQESVPALSTWGFGHGIRVCRARCHAHECERCQRSAKLHLRLRRLAKRSTRIWLRSDSSDHYVTRSKKQLYCDNERGWRILGDRAGLSTGGGRYWDTGDVWEKGDRFRVTSPRSKHYLRYGTTSGY
jgi:hypothetical protein